MSTRSVVALFAVGASALLLRPCSAAVLMTFAEGQKEPLQIGSTVTAGTLLICESTQFIQNTAGVYSCVNAGGTVQEPSDTVTFIANSPAMGLSQVRFCSEIDGPKEPDGSNDVITTKTGACSVKSGSQSGFSLAITTGTYAIQEPAGGERMTEKMPYNPTVATQPGYGKQGTELLEYELISDTPKPQAGVQNPGKSGGKSVAYDASTQVLSFANDVMTDTGFTGDPILGASVNVPNLRLVGLMNDGGFMFSSDPGAETFSIILNAQVFLQAQLPVLTYLPDTNQFVGALTNFVLSDLGSPWIAAMADIFDQGAPGFDTERSLLWFSYSPGSEMFELTDGFTASARSEGTNGVFADFPIPEPSTLALIAFGTWGLARSRRTLSPTEQAAREGLGTTFQVVKSSQLPIPIDSGTRQPNENTAYNGMQATDNGDLILKGFASISVGTTPGILRVRASDLTLLTRLETTAVAAARLTIATVAGPEYLYGPGQTSSLRFLLDPNGFLPDNSFTQPYLAAGDGTTPGSSDVFMGYGVIFSNNTEPNATTPMRLFGETATGSPLSNNAAFASSKAAWNFFMVAGDPFRTGIVVVKDELNGQISGFVACGDGKSVEKLWENASLAVSAGAAIAYDRGQLYVDDRRCMPNGDCQLFLVVLDLVTGIETRARGREGCEAVDRTDIHRSGQRFTSRRPIRGMWSAM